MVVVKLRGVEVDFPYEPYRCQVIYMEKVIECLDNGWNGVLESPTGTGKTLCLLCSCLAWVDSKRRTLLKEEANGAVPSTSTASVNNVVQSDNGDAKGCTNGLPRIIYTSRTHSQLAQVVRELNKTIYRDSLRVCTLGSRDQMCVNPEVSSEANSALKNHMCRNKVKNRECVYYGNVERHQGDLIGSEAKGTIPDIEDLVSYGSKFRVCPYYLSLNLKESADLILMPYTYMLDPKIRRITRVELKGNILIFDEAHNLQSVCEDSASVSISSKDVALCLKEAKEALDARQKETEEYRKTMDETEVPFGEVGATAGAPDQTLNVEELAHLIVLLHNLEKQLDTLDTPNPSIAKHRLPGLICPGNFLYQLLDKADIKPHLAQSLVALIDCTVQYLSNRNVVWSSRGAGLQKFSSFLGTAFAKARSNDVALENPRSFFADSTKHFKCYLCREIDSGPGAADRRNANSNAWSSLSSLNKGKPAGVVLNYWCFSAAPSMQVLMEEGVRSIIVTSGTLSPLSSFVDEMEIPFHISLENDHVINRHQVWSGIVSGGPNGASLAGSMANRTSDYYIGGIGNALVNFMRLIPQGCLVFFSSYSQMNICIEKWKTCGIYERIDAAKPVLVEPKGKNEFHAVIDEFRRLVDNVTGRGAVLFAVCRGKVSEGVDFADNQCRAAFIIGIPFPPLLEPKVVLKKEYLAEKCKRKDDAYANSNEWYTLEAVKAVNQAIGRAIRHKDDFGCIILMDIRFGKWNKNNFPSWIKNSMTLFDVKEFGRAVASLVAFFKGQKGLLELHQKKRSEQEARLKNVERDVSRREKFLNGEIKAKNSASSGLSKRFALEEVLCNINDSDNDRLICKADCGNPTVSGVSHEALEEVQRGGSSRNVRTERPVVRKRVDLIAEMEKQDQCCDMPSTSRQVRKTVVSSRTDKEHGSSCGTMDVPQTKRKRIRLVISKSDEILPENSAVTGETQKSYVQSYMEKLMSEVPLLRKKLLPVIKNYSVTRDIAELCDSASQIFLPSYPQFLEGLHPFVKEKDRARFAVLCQEVISAVK